MQNHKYKHYNIPGHFHALNFACYKNQPLLEIGNSKNILADSIEKARAIHQFNLLAWVFMPYHIHLLLNPLENEYSISGILKSIKQSSANRIIPMFRDKGPEFLNLLETGLAKPKYRFWQDGGGFDRNLFGAEAVIREIEYMHNNPVRRGLVLSVIEWEYSSARDWLTGNNGPILVCTNKLEMI